MSDAEYKIENPAEQAVKPGLAAPHPGAFIKHEVLAPFGLKISRAAELIDFHRATLSEVIAGKRDVSPSLAYKLEALTGVNADLMIGMQAAYDRWRDQEERLSYRKTIKRLPLPA